MRIVTPSEAENAVLAELAGDYAAYSEMTLDERRFLNCLLLREKPRKVLELGVSAGSSSAIILNAIKGVDGALLHSHDYLKYYYQDKTLASGFVVDGYPGLAASRRRYAGGLACKFMDSVGDGVDFCLIDTMHKLPGEALDFLMVLPYLRDGCTLVFHDTQLHTDAASDGRYVNCLLMSSVAGEKLISLARPGRENRGDSRHAFPKPAFANIGAVVIGPETREHVWEIFNLLTLRWSYMPPSGELDDLSRHYRRFYDPICVDFFDAIVDYQRGLGGVGGAWRDPDAEVERYGLGRHCGYLLKRGFYRVCAAATSGDRSALYRRRLAGVDRKIASLAATRKRHD